MPQVDYAELAELFVVFAIALVLGAFIGLERERREMRPLGIRSFTFISGSGAISAYVSDVTGQVWVLPAAFVVIGSLILIGHIGYMEKGRHGLTTELAAVMAFGIGVMVIAGPLELAVALGVATAAILHFKPQLHALADRAGGRHMFAMLQFGMVAFVVLPVLPNRAYGPFDVLNPYNIWLMVVLVSAINLAGYVSYRLVGAQRGGAVAGLVGGMVSSTATTFSFARQARLSKALNYVAALAIVLSTAVSVPRIAIEIGIVNPSFLADMWLALAILLVASLLPFAYFWFAGKGQEDVDPPDVKNPVQLGAALIFGLAYGVITLAMAAGEHYFGDAGIYLISGISGLTNVDAITLSTARLVREGLLDVGPGKNAIVIAYMANLVTKAALATFAGNRALGVITCAAFGTAAVAGVLVIIFL